MAAAAAMEEPWDVPAGQPRPEDIPEGYYPMSHQILLKLKKISEEKTFEFAKQYEQDTNDMTNYEILGWIDKKGLNAGKIEIKKNDNGKVKILFNQTPLHYKMIKCLYIKKTDMDVFNNNIHNLMGIVQVGYSFVLFLSLNENYRRAISDIDCYYPPHKTWLKITKNTTNDEYQAKNKFSWTRLVGSRSLNHLERMDCKFLTIDSLYNHFKKKYNKFLMDSNNNGLLAKLAKKSLSYQSSLVVQESIFNNNPDFKNVYDKIGTIAHMHASR
jgi:hypothetical protein